MKTQTKIFILIVSVILIPQIVSASWWNPFTWFRNSKQTTQIVEPTLVQPAKEPASVSETTPKQNTEPKIIERIVEKPITQTITVQDPTLQARINTLIAENESLKKEIARLKAEKSATVKPEEAWCSDARTEYNEIKERYAKLQEEKLAVADSFVNCGTQCNSELAKFKIEEDLLKKEEASIKEDITYYCG